MDQKIHDIIIEDVDDEIRDLKIKMEADVIWEKLSDTEVSDDKTRDIQALLSERAKSESQNCCSICRDILFKYGYLEGMRAGMRQKMANSP